MATVSLKVPATGFRGPHFLPGGGEMGELVRATDWERTPLGPLEAWPQSLRTSVSICLESRFPILLWWGPELVMIYNDAYRPILGVKHPQSMGQAGLACWSEIGGIIGPMLRGVLEDGQATWSEDQMLPLARNGYVEECFFTFSYSPIYDESGGVGGVFTAVNETTERVVGERRLRLLRDLSEQSTLGTVSEACARAGEILETGPDDVPFALLYLLSEDGSRARLATSTRLSPGAPAAPLEIAVDACTAWPIEEAARTRRAVVVDDLLSRHGELSGGQWPEAPHTAVVLPVERAGQERPHGFFVCGVSPRRALDAAYLAFLSMASAHVATAITNARAYEDERRRAEQLAELDRAKTTFFANASHELRTPLTLVLGPADDALADPLLAPGDRERWELVQRSAIRLRKLVDGLLDFARIEAGRVEPVFEATDLSSATTELTSMFCSAVERAGLRLVVDAPPLARPVHVDPEMYEKIVSNLLSNALKHTFEGEITVALRERGDVVELEVKDTGVGIAHEEQARVFGRFERLASTRSRTHEGTGIGLALVRELARLHGGDVTLKSAPGEGASFTVTIPRRSEAPEPKAIRTASRSGARGHVDEALAWMPRAVSPGEPLSTARGDARKRILLVDDNPDMRAYVAKLLRDRWDVETVEDGAKALESIRRSSPDLVLSDVMMPGLDGLSLVRELRADPKTRSLPVVLLTARAGEGESLEGYALGVNDYLVKPFSARELLVRVSAQLATREAARSTTARDMWLASIFEVSPDPMIVVSATEEILEWNSAAKRVFGYERAEVLGRSVRILTPDERTWEYRHVVQRLAQGGTVHQFETVRRAKDGSLVDVSISSTPLVDGSRMAILRDMRERTRMEVGLRRAHAAVERSTDFIGFADLQGNPTYLNPAARRLVGIDPSADVTQMRMGDFLLPEDRPAMAEVIERVCAGEEVTTEIRLRHLRTGELVPAQCTLFGIQDARTGRVESIATATRDLRDVKARERYTRELARAVSDASYAEYRFRALLEATATLVWWTAPDGRVVGDMPSWRAFTGQSIEEASGHGWLDAIHPDDRKSALASWSEAAANKRVLATEHRLRRSDGTYATMLVRAAPVFDEEGDVREWIGLNIDVTADRELLARMDALLDGLPLGVAFFDREHRYRIVNPKLAELDRREVTAHLGRTPGDLFVPSLAGLVEAPIRDVFATGKPVSLRELAVESEERTTFWDALYFPVTVAESVVGVGLVLDHITDRRSAEQERRRNEHFREIFIGMLGHDLRTPLSAVVTGASLALARGQLSPADQRVVERIQRSGTRMARMIDQILDFTRARAGGGIPVVRVPADLHKLTRKVVDELVQSRPGARIDLDLSGRSVGEWDADRLEQVLSNVVGNALDHGEGGARVVVAQREDAVTIEVHNEGDPIPSSVLPELFDPFRQAAKQSRAKTQGLGLGLFISKQIVAAHGGTIHVASRAGDGTRFSIIVPFST